MRRTPGQARLTAEQGVRDAHPGKRPAFGEPCMRGAEVRVPYVAGAESGESIASVDDDSPAVQVFSD